MIYSPNYPWTIRRISDDTFRIFYLKPGGSIDNNSLIHEHVVQPTFSLLSSVKYKTGEGTNLNPYIVGLSKDK